VREFKRNWLHNEPVINLVLSNPMSGCTMMFIIPLSLCNGNQTEKKTRQIYGLRIYKQTPDCMFVIY
jgi:hypothetical protein